MEVPFGQELGLWAYLLLALLVMVEGPVATLAGAVAASAGLMNPVWVFISAASGDLVADTLWYTLGYMGKREWLHRYGAWVGIKERHVNRFTRDVEKHATKILLIAKLTLGFSIPALVATGFARVPMRRWFFVLVFGETVWTGLLVVLGFYFGRYVQQLERGVELVALVGGGIFIFLLFGYIARLRRQAALGADSGEEHAAANSEEEAFSYADAPASEEEQFKIIVEGNAAGISATAGNGKASKNGGANNGGARIGGNSGSDQGAQDPTTAETKRE